MAVSGGGCGVARQRGCCRPRDGGVWRRWDNEIQVVSVWGGGSGCSEPLETVKKAGGGGSDEVGTTQPPARMQKEARGVGVVVGGSLGGKIV